MYKNSVACFWNSVTINTITLVSYSIISSYQYHLELFEDFICIWLTALPRPIPLSYLFPPCRPVSSKAYLVRYPPPPNMRERGYLILKKGVASGGGRQPLSKILPLFLIGGGGTGGKVQLILPVKPLSENATAEPGHHSVGQNTHQQHTRQDINQEKIRPFEEDIQHRYDN
jgi:hypothetical protein